MTEPRNSNNNNDNDDTMSDGDVSKGGAAQPGTSTVNKKDTADFDVETVKWYTFNLSLTLNDTATHTARKQFASLFDKIMQCNSLDEETFAMTNKEGAKVTMANLPVDPGAFKEFMGADVTKRHGANLHFCVSVHSTVQFRRLKHFLHDYIREQRIWLELNRLNSMVEMVTYGLLARAHHDLNRDQLQKDLNNGLAAAISQLEDDELVRMNVTRGMEGDVVVSSGAASSQYGGNRKQRIAQEKGIILRCPKHQYNFYVEHTEEALKNYKWAPDHQLLRFIPFALKSAKAGGTQGALLLAMAIKATTEFANQRTFVKINGITRSDMDTVKGLLTTECVGITNIDPTPMTLRMGQWHIFALRSDLKTVASWLDANLEAFLDKHIDNREVMDIYSKPRRMVEVMVEQTLLDALALEFEDIVLPPLANKKSFPGLGGGRQGNQRKSTGAWQKGPPPQILPPSGTPTTPSVTASTFDSNMASINKMIATQADKITATEQKSLELTANLNTIQETLGNLAQNFSALTTRQDAFQEQLLTMNTNINQILQKITSDQPPPLQADMTNLLQRLTSLEAGGSPQTRSPFRKKPHQKPPATEPPGNTPEWHLDHSQFSTSQTLHPPDDRMHTDPSPGPAGGYS